MNFLSAAINTFTGNSIPYSIGQLIPTGHDIWTVNEGMNKENKHVTIFSFDLDPRKPKQISIGQIDNGCRIHKMFSVLPGMLKLDDFIQNDHFVYLITEPVTKLNVGEYNNEIGVLGIYQIVSVLRLIHERGVSHNGGLSNDLLNCIYINSKGEWKLTGFERAQENQQGKLDSKLVAEFIYNLFKPGDNFNQSDAIRISGSGVLHKLPIANLLNGKWSVDEFISNGELPGKWFDTTAIRCYRKYQEFHILETHQKLELFKAMAVCDGFDPKFLINCGMVQMETTFDVLLAAAGLPNKGQALAQIVYLMHLIMIKSNDDSKGQSVFKSCYFKGLPVADRTVRLILLKLLSHLNSFLTDYEIQDKVYPQLTSGFADTDLTMRTETLNSIAMVIGKITDRQLNNDLLRHLAKLQIDPNPILRISVIDTLVSISSQMHQTTRAGILITAFGKGLKDSHIKVRLTAVDAFIKTLQYFDAESCCFKVIGALAPAMVDKSSHVRAEAQKAMELCMVKIETFIGKMNDSGESIEDGIDNAPINIQLEQLGDSLLLEIPDLGEVNITKAKTYSSTASPTPTGSPMPGNVEVKRLPKLGSFGKSKLNSSFDNLIIDDEDEDEGWGFGDDNDNHSENKPKPKPISLNKTKSTTTTRTPVSKKPGMTLGKRSTASKLKVEAKIDDDDDDGWGNGW